MSIKPKDPLLTAGKAMTTFLMVIIGIVTVIFIGVIPFILFHQAEFAAKVIEGGGDSVSLAMAAAIALALLAAAVAAAAFHFFQLLGRIIDTVRENDPFTAENADRITRMGWIALGFQIAAITIGALATYLSMTLPSEDFTVDFEFSLTGLLLAIVLFILARVFKHGAEMREDLEGTV